jgi:hypothetical protein
MRYQDLWALADILGRRAPAAAPQKAQGSLE